MPQSPQMSSLAAFPTNGLLLAQGPIRQSGLVAGQEFQQFLNDAFDSKTYAPPEPTKPALDKPATASTAKPSRDAKETNSTKENAEESADVSLDEEPSNPEIVNPLLAWLMQRTSASLTTMPSDDRMIANALRQDISNPQQLSALVTPTTEGMSPFPPDMLSQMAGDLPGTMATPQNLAQSMLQNAGKAVGNLPQQAQLSQVAVPAMSETAEAMAVDPLTAELAEQGWQQGSGLVTGDINAMQVQKLAQTPGKTGVIAPQGHFTSRFEGMAASIPADALPEEIASQRIMVMSEGKVPGQGMPLPVGHPAHVASPPVLANALLTPQLNGEMAAAMMAANPEAWLASPEASGNGFTNGFANNAMTAAGVAGAGTASQSNASQGSPVATGSSQRTSLSTSVSDFPDLVTAELGRTRMVTRPNQPEQIRVQLEPKELGELDMQIRVDHEKQVHLLITTESENAKELLQKQMGQLKEALASQNLTFGDVRVEVGDKGQQGEAWRQARQQAGNAARESAATLETRPASPTPAKPTRWLPGGGISIHA